MEVISQLRATERDLLQRRDRRAVFVTAYLEITQLLLARIGSFEDAAWVERYAVAFANLYFAAHDAYESRHMGRVPRAWRIAFSLSKSGRALVIQDLLLGINAHIRQDLPHALVAVETAFDDQSRRSDHDGINRVMVRAIDPIQDKIAVLYSPLLGRLDQVLGQLDEALTAAGIRLGRSAAWRKALRLDAAHDPLEVREREEAIEEGAVCVARVLLAPTRIPWLCSTLRAKESGHRWMEVYRGLDSQGPHIADR